MKLSLFEAFLRDSPGSVFSKRSHDVFSNLSHSGIDAFIYLLIYLFSRVCWDFFLIIFRYVWVGNESLRVVVTG